MEHVHDQDEKEWGQWVALFDGSVHEHRFSGAAFRGGFDAKVCPN